MLVNRHCEESPSWFTSVRELERAVLKELAVMSQMGAECVTARATHTPALLLPIGGWPVGVSPMHG